MAGPATAGDEQQIKQRAMRRLALALGLIAIAIVGLVLLDQYSGRKRPFAPETPSSEPPPIANLPEPKPLPSAPPTAEAPATEPAPALPPPPPPTVEEPATPSSAGRVPAQAAPGTKKPESALVAGRSASPGTVQGPKPRASGGAATPGPDAAQTLAARQGFVVQLGVFTTVENAQALQARLKEQGMPAFLETRVVVGPFRDRAEADAAQHKLKALGVSGVIVQGK